MYLHATCRGCVCAHLLRYGGGCPTPNLSPAILGRELKKCAVTKSFYMCQSIMIFLHASAGPGSTQPGQSVVHAQTILSLKYPIMLWRSLPTLPPILPKLDNVYPPMAKNYHKLNTHPKKIPRTTRRDCTFPLRKSYQHQSASRSRCEHRKVTCSIPGLLLLHASSENVRHFPNGRAYFRVLSILNSVYSKTSSKFKCSIDH